MRRGICIRGESERIKGRSSPAMNQSGNLAIPGKPPGRSSRSGVIASVILKLLLMLIMLIGSGGEIAFAKKISVKSRWMQARKAIRHTYSLPVHLRESVDHLLSLMQVEGMDSAQVLDGVKGEEAVYLPHLYLSYAYFRTGQYESALAALEKCKDRQFMSNMALELEVQWFDKLNEVLPSLLGAEKALKKSTAPKYQNCLSQGPGIVQSLQTERGKIVRRGPQWTIVAFLASNVDEMKSFQTELRETLERCDDGASENVMASATADLELYENCIDQKDIDKILSESSRDRIDELLREYRAVLPGNLRNQQAAEKWNDRLGSFCDLVVTRATRHGKQTAKRLRKIKEAQPGFFREARLGGRPLEESYQQLENPRKPGTSVEKVSFVEMVIEAGRWVDVADEAVLSRLNNLKVDARRYLENEFNSLSDEDQCLMVRSNRLESWRQSLSRLDAATGGNSIDQLEDATRTYTDEITALQSERRAVKPIAARAADKAKTVLEYVMGQDLGIPGCTNPAEELRGLDVSRERGLSCLLLKKSERIAGACEIRVAEGKEDDGGRIAMTLERVDAWIALDGRLPSEVDLDHLREARKALSDLSEKSVVPLAETEEACQRADGELEKSLGALEATIARSVESRERWLGEGCWEDGTGTARAKQPKETRAESSDLSREAGGGVVKLLNQYDRIVREEARAAVACAFRAFFRDGDPQSSIRALQSISSAQTTIKASQALILSISFFHWVAAQSMEEGEERGESLTKARTYLADLDRGLELDPERLMRLLPPDFIAWADVGVR